MNLEHCFTASMTAHSISTLSELKMSSFGPYAETSVAFHQLRYQLHSVARFLRGNGKNIFLLQIIHCCF